MPLILVISNEIDRINCPSVQMNYLFSVLNRLYDWMDPWWKTCANDYLGWNYLRNYPECLLVLMYFAVCLFNVQNVNLTENYLPTFVILPDIEFDIELGMLTGCDVFCSKPVEAKPADIEFSKWLKSRLPISSVKLAAYEMESVI